MSEKNENKLQELEKKGISTTATWLIGLGLGAVVAVVTGIAVYKIKSARERELKGRKYNYVAGPEDFNPTDEDIKSYSATAGRYWSFAVSTFKTIRDSSVNFFKTEANRPIASSEESKAATEHFNNLHAEDEL